MNYDINFNDDEYEFTVLRKHHQYLGHFPTSYKENADLDAARLLQPTESIPRQI
jgi:hypothetical protein